MAPNRMEESLGGASEFSLKDNIAEALELSGGNARAVNDDDR